MSTAQKNRPGRLSTVAYWILCIIFFTLCTATFFDLIPDFRDIGTALTFLFGFITLFISLFPKHNTTRPGVAFLVVVVLLIFSRSTFKLNDKLVAEMEASIKEMDKPYSENPVYYNPYDRNRALNNHYDSLAEAALDENFIRTCVFRKAYRRKLNDYTKELKQQRLRQQVTYTESGFGQATVSLPPDKMQIIEMQEEDTTQRIVNREKVRDMGQLCSAAQAAVDQTELVIFKAITCGAAGRFDMRWALRSFEQNAMVSTNGIGVPVSKWDLNINEWLQNLVTQANSTGADEAKAAFRPTIIQEKMITPDPGNEFGYRIVLPRTSIAWLKTNSSLPVTAVIVTELFISCYRNQAGDYVAVITRMNILNTKPYNHATGLLAI